MSFGQLLEGESPVLRQEEMSQAMRRRSANINLQKSIRLLDESVGTPGSILRKTPKVLRHSSYTPRHMPTGSKFDVSSLGLGTPGASIIATPSAKSVYGESASDTMLFPHTKSFHNEQTIMEEEVATTNVALLQEDPTLAACTGMYEDFKKYTQRLGSEAQLFELLSHYEQICGDNVMLLKKLVKNAVPGQHKFAKTVDMLRSINCEKKTWRLIASLYRDRLETEFKNGEESMLIDSLMKLSSEKEVMSALYERDSAVRQAQLVVDWLEKNAEEELEDCYDNVEFFSDNTGSWENTLHRLKQKGNMSASIYGSERPIVTEIDPDAPIRQRRPLCDLDMEDEVRLLRHMFAYVRAGQLEEAEKLCGKVGQSWRAATLEGWRLSHDPNYSAGTVGAPVEGNSYRDVWKVVCWRLADEHAVVCLKEHLHSYERGIYAALSGNLRQLLGACDTWEDFLWAYTRCMVDVRVEQELRVGHALAREWAALPQGYGHKVLNMESIFQEMQASTKERVRAESSERHRVIQKYVILDDVDRIEYGAGCFVPDSSPRGRLINKPPDLSTKYTDRMIYQYYNRNTRNLLWKDGAEIISFSKSGLVEDMAEWSRDEMSPPDPLLLRFMAHLVLFFRSIGLNTKECACECILEAYVSHLVRNRQLPLVAYYVAALQPQHQVQSYAAFLEGIREREERVLCLAYAEESCLDVPLITKCVVERIRQRESTEFDSTGELARELNTNADDRLKIEAIDWLVFDESQRAEAMKQANALMRTFVAAQKLSAAREVFNKLPVDSIDVIARTWQMETGSTLLLAEDDNAIREYLCMKAFLDAHDSFNDWFQHYHHAKPAAPDNPPGANFTERVAFEHRQKQYEAELDRWRHTLVLQTKMTKEKMYNVLLFLNGGWMVDQREPEGGADEQRQHQMKLLRQLCLPPLCFLLHSVLHTTAQYRDCLQLADVIASEQHRLYTVFRRDERQKLLQKLCESSVKLLDSNLDPLGYPLS